MLTEEKILFLKPEQEKDKTYFTDKDVSWSICLFDYVSLQENLIVVSILIVYFFYFQTGVELELVDSMALLEWFANNYKVFGSTLEIITDRSQEGAQFVKGFGGIGGKISLL